MPGIVGVPELPWPEPDLSDGAVTLRRWGAADLPALIEAGADPEIRRFRYSLPADEREARRWIARHESERRARRRLELAVATADAQRPVGSISLTDLGHGNVEIRYWLLAGARGHGTASAALDLLAAWAFAVWRAERLELHVEADNRASCRLAERCGFVLEGRLRSQVQTREGGRADLLIYGLLPGEAKSCTRTF